MKHEGCILAFTKERNREIMAAYRKAISNTDHIVIFDIAERVENTPCSRFWVSEERALAVISEMESNIDILSVMRPLKQEMYTEIYHRVQVMRESNPSMSLSDIVFHVVNSPAPRFYLRPRCVMDIIYKIKNGFYEKQ